MRMALVLHKTSPQKLDDFITRHDLLDDMAPMGNVYSLRLKMKNGAFAAIPGFDQDRHTEELDLLRQKYLYKIVFIDVSGNPEPPPLPKPFRNCKNWNLDKITPGMNVKTWLDRNLFPIVDLSKYKSVYHIGDIQGCSAPLEDFLNQYFDPESFYIFCGDYLDRGPQNDSVFLRLHDDLMNRENVMLLWGNHESDLIRFANGRPLKIAEFRDATLPQLLGAGVTREMAYDFCKKLRDVFVYQYGRKKVLCCHGGVLDLPRRFLTHPSREFRGEATKDLKELFDGPVVMHHSFNAAVNGTEWIQVHGHTNAEKKGINHFQHTILLNDYPELGKSMRVWRLEADGTGTPIYIKSVLPPRFKPQNLDCMA
ncbi:MAG: metallophosphoesterase [Rhodospirillales bacterium]|nr:metallophosphoesterase [Rhodospirillales bacterium]